MEIWPWLCFGLRKILQHVFLCADSKEAINCTMFISFGTQLFKVKFPTRTRLSHAEERKFVHMECNDYCNKTPLFCQTATGNLNGDVNPRLCVACLSSDLEFILMLHCAHLSECSYRTSGPADSPAVRTWDEEVSFLLLGLLEFFLLTVLFREPLSLYGDSVEACVYAPICTDQGNLHST